MIFHFERIKNWFWQLNLKTIPIYRTSKYFTNKKPAKVSEKDYDKKKRGIGIRLLFKKQKPAT